MEHGKFTTYTYSKENENQGIRGAQRIFEVAEEFVRLSPCTVNWKDNLLFHVAEKYQKEAENIVFFYKVCTYPNCKGIREIKSMYIRIFNSGMDRREW